jgi:hypothetical protein
LREILAHNCDEEKEHAPMVLEWIRRKVPAIDNEPKDYLFTEKSIAHIDRYLINSTEAVDLNIYFLTK